MDTRTATEELTALHAEFRKGSKQLGTEAFIQLSNRIAEIEDWLAEQAYRELDFEARIDWWAAATHRQLRMQAEEGADPLLIFDRQWVEQAQRKEPRLLEIFEQVCTRLRLPFAVLRKLLAHDAGSEAWRRIRASLPATALYA